MKQKYSLEEFKNSLDQAEERINEHEYREVEFIQRNKVKKEQKREDNLRDLKNTMGANIYIIGVPQREKRKKGK